MAMVPEIMILQDRVEAAHMLADKLLAYKNSNAVVVAVPRGGVPIGSELAKILNLSFEIVGCKKIKHPAYGDRSIGSVSIDDTVVKEELRNIPQDYIYHQVILLQHTLRAKCDYYRGNKPMLSLHKKTVIVVDDLLYSGDTVMACLKSIRRQGPEKIILAAAAATPEAAQIATKEVDDFIAVHVERIFDSKEIFPPVSDEEVRNILLNV